MKVKDLSVGNIYQCLLSGKKVLIIETEEQEQKDEKGKVIKVIPPAKAGKAVVNLDNGDYKFVYTEIHDGQFE